MHQLTKILAPAVLAVSLVAIAGCDSASQAQTVRAVSAQVETDTQTAETIAPAVATTVLPKVQNWLVNAEKSHIKFGAWQEGAPFEGAFEAFTADIKFHPENLEASSVTVTVPLSGVDAGSTDRNSTLPGKGWFSTKKFPDAVFTAKLFKPMGEGAYDAIGQLTIKGISRDLSLPFTLDVTGDTAVMRSTLLMNRTDWAIGEKPWDTGNWVSKDVQLDIMVTAQIEE